MEKATEHCAQYTTICRKEKLHTRIHICKCMEYFWKDMQDTTGLLRLLIRENEEQQKETDLFLPYTLKNFVLCVCIYHSNKLAVKNRH